MPSELTLHYVRHLLRREHQAAVRRGDEDTDTLASAHEEICELLGTARLLTILCHLSQLQTGDPPNLADVRVIGAAIGLSHPAVLNFKAAAARGMQPQCADDMCHHKVEWRCARKRCARFAWFSYSTSSKKVRALAYHNDDSRKQSSGDDSNSRNFNSGRPARISNVERVVLLSYECSAVRHPSRATSRPLARGGGDVCWHLGRQVRPDVGGRAHAGPTSHRLPQGVGYSLPGCCFRPTAIG